MEFTFLLTILCGFVIYAGVGAIWGDVCCWRSQIHFPDTTNRMERITFVTNLIFWPITIWIGLWRVNQGRF